ncbi:Helix-turn-helix [Oceanobacillus oncorhynchi]|uniref:Helix-turn-helix n=2 Tax=Oceanobacillus oncorhynchi TaxID=545501 RepID=A0A0A1MQU2_9BACI|nr:Helix-turn-helix [Oceanobacillus oncorhynchi]
MVMQMKLVIEELIREKGYQKRYIAEQMGITNNTLTHWMKNRSMIKLDQAVKLAEVLDCELEDLFIIENDDGGK